MKKAHHSGIQLLESLLECYLNSILEQNFTVISTSFFLSLLFFFFFNLKEENSKHE